MMVNRDEKIFLTPDEAFALIPDGEYAHNMVGGGFMVLGCDISREGTRKAFDEADFIEVGGPTCQAMRHPIVVHEKGGRHSFFEADMGRFYEKFPGEKAAA